MDRDLANNWGEYSLLQKTVAVIFIANGILCIYGIVADYIPSHNAVNASYVVTTIACVLFLVIIIWNGRMRLKYYFRGKSKSKKLFHILILPFVLWLYIYIALTHGLMSLATYTFGNSAEFTISGNIEHSFAKGCDYRFKSDFVKTAFPSYICLDRTIYMRNKSNMEITFEGRQSIFGIQVTKIISIIPLTSGSSGSANSLLHYRFAAH
jgi:uncharacterized membrane protein